MRPASFLIANHLRGPSYVSMESALSYWSLIPERVYEVSSVTVKTAKTYKTDIGRFSYHHAAFPYYTFGVRRAALSARQTILIASPEKALCDKIIMTSGVILRSKKQVLDFLIEDLRMDEDLLDDFNLDEMDTWLEDAPKRSSIQMLIKTLRTR